VTILYHPPPSHDEKTLVIKFEPPLETPFEARGRIMEWKDKALEHFDVVGIEVRCGEEGSGRR
jgi:hypothetical protein